MSDRQREVTALDVINFARDYDWNRRTDPSHKPLTRTERQVFTHLATFANHRTGLAGPGIARIAVGCGLKVTADGTCSAVSKALKGLEGRGLIRSWQRGNAQPAVRQILSGLHRALDADDTNRACGLYAHPASGDLRLSFPTEGQPSVPTEGNDQRTSKENQAPSPPRRFLESRSLQPHEERPDKTFRPSGGPTTNTTVDARSGRLKLDGTVQSFGENPTTADVWSEVA